MELLNIKDILQSKSYLGRGIVIGKSEDDSKAVFAYFISGRSANSRNRIFKEEGNDLIIYPFDEAKVEDPSLIIYYPVRTLDKKIIVTNGDQTDTIYEGYLKSCSFEDSLSLRCFEPDAPNYTPRISGVLDFEDEYKYELSILKAMDKEGKSCMRNFFHIEPVAGVGHFIHTYEGDGNPLPSFKGEPQAVRIPNDIKIFSNEIWNHLDKDNKISLYVKSVNLKNQNTETYLFNKYKKEL